MDARCSICELPSGEHALACASCCRPLSDAVNVGDLMFDSLHDGVVIPQDVLEHVVQGGAVTRIDGVWRKVHKITARGGVA